MRKKALALCQFAKVSCSVVFLVSGKSASMFLMLSCSLQLNPKFVWKCFNDEHNTALDEDDLQSKLFFLPRSLNSNPRKKDNNNNNRT